ncbi:MAG: redoxin family protein [Xanthomonadales bacterium]|nr:redoxin family protein [Xanthomonadales bacterium]NIN59038.1 redoxin family protein [Xanthomonadales bacterium]NIN74484.1 redoxin family protein [Xanthomonadales bacterium]NIO14806.1 redoxin family protein [Xanthomonadales bacterium]NIP11431.1 redoxin family protein [Xanthomonadales bacterium]
MSIQVGDRIPEAKLTMMTPEGPDAQSTSEYFAGRTVVLFAVPGAFTPTCSAKHLPGFIELEADIRGKGVDAIACMAVNDVFVMSAWGKSANAGGIDMLADGNGAFTAALGLGMDASAFGMGQRSQRFALVAEDGVVTQLFVEAPGEFRVSAAEHVLQSL